MLVALVGIWSLLFICVVLNIKLNNIFVIGDYVEFKDRVVATVFFLFLSLTMVIGLLIIFKGVYGQW